MSASEIDFTIVVDADRLRPAVGALHCAFFGSASECAVAGS